MDDLGVEGEGDAEAGHKDVPEAEVEEQVVARVAAPSKVFESFNESTNLDQIGLSVTVTINGVREKVIHLISTSRTNNRTGIVWSTDKAI